MFIIQLQRLVSHSGLDTFSFSNVNIIKLSWHTSLFQGKATSWAKLMPNENMVGNVKVKISDRATYFISTRGITPSFRSKAMRMTLKDKKIITLTSINEQRKTFYQNGYWFLTRSCIHCEYSVRSIWSHSQHLDAVGKENITLKHYTCRLISIYIYTDCYKT